MATRHENDGLRKRCGCPRRNWPKCSHDWHFNFKPRGGRPWLFCLDVELGRRMAGKGEAEAEAARIRAEIFAGTFVRAAERRKAGTVAPGDELTVEQLGSTYFEKHTNHKSGKALSKNERSRWDLIMWQCTTEPAPV
jgi:hypothetical protein